MSGFLAYSKPSYRLQHCLEESYSFPSFFCCNAKSLFPLVVRQKSDLWFGEPLLKLILAAIAIVILIGSYNSSLVYLVQSQHQFDH